ncbi:unnamed protein product, partial [Closterium sp. NIES-53]
VGGDCYSCVPCAAGVEAAVLGACESVAAGTAFAEALHTFTLDFGTSCYSRTGKHLATFTRSPGSSLYTLLTESAQVATSGQVAASAQVATSDQLAASCSCWLLSHQTLLWHQTLVTPPCRACVACTLVSLSLASPARRSSLLVSPDVCSPVDSPAERSVLRLHSDRGGEFSLDFLLDLCLAEGIRETFTLPASPKQNGIAERRISLLNLLPRVSMPETSRTLRWTGEVGDASAFQVRGALSLVRNTTVSKLSPRTLRSLFLGFPTDASLFLGKLSPLTLTPGPVFTGRHL